MKTCRTCGIEKDVEDFPSNGRYRRTECRICYNAGEWARINRLSPASKAKRQETTERYRQNNVQKIKQQMRSSILRRKYGLTVEDWNWMFLSQGHRCAICGSRNSWQKNGWHTDHNHQTNEVRGILCRPCNQTVGHVEGGWLVEVPAISRYLEIYT